LLEHGRLGLEQLINTVRRKRTSRGGAEFENDIFNKAFWHLVKERLVIQVEVGFSETQSVSSNAAATGISKDSVDEVNVQLASTNPESARLSCSAQYTQGSHRIKVESLWRVSVDEFNRRFRHIACAALVREWMIWPLKCCWWCFLFKSNNSLLSYNFFCVIVFNQRPFYVGTCTRRCWTLSVNMGLVCNRRDLHQF